MRKNEKRKLLVGAIVSLCFASAIGFTALSTESVQASDEVTKKTIEQVPFTMIEGAGVRLETDGNGLRFGATTNASDYAALMANVGEGEGYAYKDIKFGMLIAPAYYEEYYTLDEEHVFSADAKYDWAVDGKYTGKDGKEGSKVRIVNLQAREMNVNTTKNLATYYGSVVDLKDGDEEDGNVNNVALEFKGVGYIQYTLQNGDVDYLFLENNDNTRSMAYVAQQAIADETSEDRLTPTQKQKVDEIYVQKVQDVASAYTVNYYLQNPDGTYTVKETVNETLTVNAEVTLQNKYYQDYHLAKGGATTFKVLANDKTVIDFYYDRGAVWNTVANVTDFTTQTASHVDSAGTGETNSLYNVSKETVDGKGEFIKWTLKENKNNATGWRYGFNVLPAYDKAYYELYQGKNYQLVFDFMYDADDAYTGTKTAYYNNKKDIPCLDSIKTDTWYTAMQPLDTLIANWDSLHIVGYIASGRPVVELASLITLKTKNTNVAFNMYIGNFRIVPPAVTPVEDTTVNLVDVVSSDLVKENKLTLTDLISDENKTALQSNLEHKDCLTYTLTDSTGAVTAVEDGVVDVSKITLRYYTFTLKYNGTVIYTGYVDLYNSTEGVVWNTLDLVNTASEWRSYQGSAGSGEDNKYYSFSVGTVEGKTGNYARWTDNSGSGGYYNQGFALLPIHSLSYYKLFDGQGYTVSFSASYILTDEYTGEGDFKKYCNWNNDPTERTWISGIWYDVSYSLDNLIANYASLTQAKGTGGYRDIVNASIFAIMSDVLNGDDYRGLKFNVYMSEMTIAKA